MSSIIAQQIYEHDEQEKQRLASLPRKVPPPPPPQLPMVVIWKRWDLRFRDYVLRQIRTPHRIVRWSSYWVKFPWRVSSFMYAIVGPRVDPDKRNDICATCSSRIYHLMRNGTAYLHCGKCGCPIWHLSELQFKNRLKNWNCPLGKHSNTIDKQQQWLKDHKYVIQPECPGCGR